MKAKKSSGKTAGMTNNFQNCSNLINILLFLPSTIKLVRSSKKFIHAAIKAYLYAKRKIFGYCSDCYCSCVSNFPQTFSLFEGFSHQEQVRNRVRVAWDDLLDVMGVETLRYRQDVFHAFFICKIHISTSLNYHPSKIVNLKWE